MFIFNLSLSPSLWFAEKEFLILELEAIMRLLREKQAIKNPSTQKAAATFVPTCWVLYPNSASLKGGSLSGFVRRRLAERRRKKSPAHLIFSLHALIRPMLMEAISWYWSFLSNPDPVTAKTRVVESTGFCRLRDDWWVDEVIRFTI